MFGRKETDYDLIKEVNPVVNSAKGSLYMLKNAGVPEATILFERLNPYQELLADKSDFQKLVSKGLSIMQVLRYLAINSYAKKTGFTNIIDLGCGLSPRGLFFKKISNVNYVGIDLPAVINDLRIAGNDMNYVAADMTNLVSLERAMKNIDGKILVITEGVLSYFTESELKTVIHNISSLLEHYTGIWLTPDFYNNDFLTAVMEPLLGKEAYEKVKNLLHTMDKSSVGTEIRGSGSIAATGGLALAKNAGFSEKSIPLISDEITKNYMNELPASIKSAIIENCKDFRLSLLYLNAQVGNTTAEKILIPSRDEAKFTFGVTQAEDSVIISLCGRLDTISSPELLAFYENAIKNRKDGKKVVFDCSTLEYVSSAGLRVFLIVYNDREKNVELINYNETVGEILEQTGFKEFLCKE